jgi:hypothetical protein
MHVYAQPSPWLNEAEMAKAELRDSRARFLRLWHGVWGSGVGDALDEADIPAAVDESLVPMTEGMPDVAYVGGLDLGIKHDHSAFVVLARETNTQRIRLARCLSWDPDPTTGKVDLEAVEAAVLAADQQFNLSACCDRSVNTISASSGSPAVRTSKHAFKFASSLDWGSIFFYDQRLAGAPDRQPGHWAIGPVL